MQQKKEKYKGYLKGNDELIGHKKVRRILPGFTKKRIRNKRLRKGLRTTLHDTSLSYLKKGTGLDSVK